MEIKSWNKWNQAFTKFKYLEKPITVNPQNYTGINIHKSAQFFEFTSKMFMVWYLKSIKTLQESHNNIIFIFANQLFAKNAKVNYSSTVMDLRYTVESQYW